MRVLIIFNHPAPYKVKAFNELSNYVDLTVLFERTAAKDRPSEFYDDNKYLFKPIFLKDGYVGKEGSVSSNVKKFIAKNYLDYDLIIMNGYSHLAEIKAINYMHSHNIRFGLLINGGVIKSKECFLKKKYKSSLIKKAHYYISPLRSADEYLKYYGANPDLIYSYVYSNCYENEILKEPLSDKVELRKKYSLPLNKNIFVNASQFIERKNNIQLMSLFKNRDDLLVLIGEGPDRDKYISYIKENKLTNVVIKSFMKKKELFEFLRACDVYITLSKEDIFGHTTLEAFSNGLPVISSDKVVSSLEYIKDGYNGYIVHLDDEKDILDKMDKVSYQMSNNAIESARNNTFENSAKSLYKVLEEVYGK